MPATGSRCSARSSWKQSPDPDYEAKAARILALYREQPQNGVVISFDEKGPESLCPRHGRGWARRGRPERHRATFNRRHGIRYLVGALDVHADYLRIRPRPRRNGTSTLTFMRQIRLAYPKRIRIYWIQDGLSSHWTPAIRTWAAANNFELVPTPTYASFLNRIESTFGTIDEFVCKNADYLDWDAFNHALAEHVRHRNDPAERERRKIEAAKRRERRAAKNHRAQTRRLNHASVPGATLRDAALGGHSSAIPDPVRRDWACVHMCRGYESASVRQRLADAGAAARARLGVRGTRRGRALLPGVRSRFDELSVGRNACFSQATEVAEITQFERLDLIEQPWQRIVGAVSTQEGTKAGDPECQLGSFIAPKAGDAVRDQRREQDARPREILDRLGRS